MADKHIVKRHLGKYKELRSEIERQRIVDPVSKKLFKKALKFRANQQKPAVPEFVLMKRRLDLALEVELEKLGEG